MKRAIDKGLVEVHFHNLRDYTTNKKIDDYPYGGGAGMVMTVQPIDACITQLKSERDYDEIIYMSPDGETLNQKITPCPCMNIIILCGHYKGGPARSIISLRKKSLLAIMYYPEENYCASAIRCFNPIDSRCFER
jgi:tRNA (guanine37-N1)-methyltransferase